MKPLTLLRFVLLLLLMTAAVIIWEYLAADSAPSLSSSLSNTQNQAEIRNTIVTLQSFGNRTTMEKQSAVAAWISDKLTSYGMMVNRQAYLFKGRQFQNVFGQIDGKSNKDQVVVLMAHMDSTADNGQGDAPGADDDGSGIAALLEIARLIQGKAQDSTILFCFFSNEEPGVLGSTAFVKKARQEEINIRAAINVDVVGYNRPSKPFYWNALPAHELLKHKLKALWRMQRNYLLGMRVGKDAIQVARRPEHAKMVMATSAMMSKETRLKIKETIRSDCG